LLRDLVEVVSGTVKVSSVSRANATAMICCMLTFAEGQAVFPIIVPDARFHRTEETREQIVDMIDGGCTPDPASNNRIRHIAAPLASQQTTIPGALLSAAQVLGRIVSALFTTSGERAVGGKVRILFLLCSD
jgi:hypothetical protein